MREETLAEALRQKGLAESILDCIEHAQRMAWRAESVASILEAEPLKDAALYHRSEGRRAQWMHSWACLVLWAAARGTLDWSERNAQNAVYVAIDEARESYGHFATGLELA